MTASYVQARDDIVTFVTTRLAADQPSLPVFWENTLEIYLDNVADPFVRVEIEFNDADQATIELDPRHRVFASVIVTIFTRGGQGTRNLLGLIDYFTDLLKHRDVGVVRMRTPRFNDKVERGKWLGYELETPFWFDC